jgi:hypothetical protein
LSALNTSNPSIAFTLTFDSDSVNSDDDWHRLFGFSVRCLSIGGPATAAPTPIPTVTFGTNPEAVQATVTAWTDNSITVTTPPHTAGTVDVTISNGVDAVVKSQSYTYEEPYLNIDLDTEEVSITDDNGVTDTDSKVTPSLSGTFAQGSNILTTTTNSPKGYYLSLSTNLPSSASNPSDMLHQSLPGNYLPATDKICTWNDMNKTLTYNDSTISNNTYGFTLDSTNLSSQKLCQIPNSTYPLTVKSTTTATDEQTGDDTTIYYGAKINTQQLAGEYKTTIIYTALANP